MLLRQHAERSVAYRGIRMKIESRMPGYCSYISLMGVSNKIKKKKKKLAWDLDRKWKMCSKTTILSRSYNELILEFDRLCCGDKDGRVCGDVQVSGFSD